MNDTLRDDIQAEVEDTYRAGYDQKSIENTNRRTAAIMELIRQANQPLTKREEFAKAAMQGILANPENSFNAIDCAEWAIRNADALIAELNKQEVQGE